MFSSEPSNACLTCISNLVLYSLNAIIPAGFWMIVLAYLFAFLDSRSGVSVDKWRIDGVD
ncbi:hypothetical protein BVC80_1069g8 [Macleaya cordata]|uniref:Uncharacterized protein n=1 Tax=Macleaya cordata TaxID=56857 RepID=A0A200RCP6_MACCD|nr:hypothetical protein BVC80_1069g8 [Macleaya cordata]